MAHKLNVLLVEDSQDDALLIARRLRKAGYQPSTTRVQNRAEMVQALQRQKWDMVLCDHSMPNFDIGAALEVIKLSGQDLPLVIVSGAIPEDEAVSAMRAGARDFVNKANLDRLIPVIAREIHTKEIRREKFEAEKALAAQLQLLQEIIDTIPVAVFYKDLNGVYQGCNTMYERYMDINREDLLGHTMNDFMPPEFVAVHSRANHWVMKNMEPFQYETKLRYASGKVIDTMIHKAPYTDADGEVAGVVGIMIDITKRKQAEQKARDLETQLRQAQKLEAIGTLAGGIAHDFNNILAAIIGYSELARQSVEPASLAEEYLVQVLSAGNRAKTLTRQILTFSRQDEYEEKPVNVGAIAKEALKLLRASLPPQVDIKMNIDSGAGLVNADPTNIHQVLMNLATNAAHAMSGSGGTLTVTVQGVEKSQAELLQERGMQAGPYLEVTVADTGMGMTPATLERIFDPYFTTKPVGEGTGLGLSVVHGIIKGLGGAITVQSKVGRGSEFIMLLPVVGQEEIPEEADAQEPPVGDERLLLVDDEEPITDVLSSQLGKLGYKVTVFNSGDEAWAYFQSNPGQFDAVIADHLMPGMNGKELLRKIKSAEPQVKTILHTGYDACLFGGGEEPEGSDAICRKPTEKNELARVIRGLLHNKPA